MSFLDLWGEIPDPEPETNNPIGLTPAEKDMLTKLPKPLLLEGPKIYQPISSSQNKSIKVEENKNDTLKIPITRMGANLREKMRRSEFMSIEDSLMENQQQPSDINVFNRFNGVDRELFNYSLDFQPLSRQDVSRSLRRSTAEVLAFVGFYDSSSEALDCLTDIVSEFMSKFTQSLAREHERLLLGRPSGFPDVFDRVLTEMRMPSVLGLQEFYRTQVVDAYKNLVEESKTNFITAETPKSAGLFYTTGSNEDIPEIHFPSSEEGDIMDHAPSHLETGLQMLQSLEQGSLGSQGPPTVQEEDNGPMSHESNSALLLATVSPGASEVKRKKKI